MVLIQNHKPWKDKTYSNNCFVYKSNYTYCQIANTNLTAYICLDIDFSNVIIKTYAFRGTKINIVYVCIYVCICM